MDNLLPISALGESIILTGCGGGSGSDPVSDSTGAAATTQESAEEVTGSTGTVASTVGVM